MKGPNSRCSTKNFMDFKDRAGFFCRIRLIIFGLLLAKKNPVTVKRINSASLFAILNSVTRCKFIVVRHGRWGIL